MITTIFYQTPKLILERMNKLLFTLINAGIFFEEKASVIPNKQLRYTILGLAQEIKQYTSELRSHIDILGGDSSRRATAPEFNFSDLAGKPDGKFLDERHDLQDCSIAEKSLIQTYFELLEDPLLYDNIKKMIGYQLNGIRHSFSQLKLLTNCF